MTDKFAETETGNKGNKGNSTPHDGRSDSPFPTPPDLQRVREARRQLRADQAAGSKGSAGRMGNKFGQTVGEISKYTLIPSLMIAGPVVGYLLGRAVEKYIGGAPWGTVTGMLVGVVAAFRQVFLLLNRKDVS